MSQWTDKKDICVANVWSGLFLLVWTWDTFYQAVIAMKIEHCSDWKTSKAVKCQRHWPQTLSHDIQRPDQNKNVGDTKIFWRHCFPFISKLNTVDVITTSQYMKCATISTMKFRLLLKKSFHSNQTGLRYKCGWKLLFVSFRYHSNRFHVPQASTLVFSN